MGLGLVEHANAAWPESNAVTHQATQNLLAVVVPAAMFG
jgi:hypothetical protein